MDFFFLFKSCSVFPRPGFRALVPWRKNFLWKKKHESAWLQESTGVRFLVESL